MRSSPVTGTNPSPISQLAIECERGMEGTADWYWEGNVVEAIARHLERDGWSIVTKADTRTKERGIDIYAVRSGRVLLVEAKGYPSKSCRDPRRGGETHQPD